MKRLLSGSLLRNSQSFASTRPSKQLAFFLTIVLFFGFLMMGCKKESLNSAGEEIQNKTSRSTQPESNGFGNYKDGLAPKTLWELQQAKIATAKYNNFENAIKDGYVDINVIIPEMGYHYLKMENLNATFEFDKPEILVYNKEENGRMKLLALEYAVPIALSPNGPPSGFTGTSDVWTTYQETLWTLHAWIWEFNPAGVFNATNPLVHVH